MQNVSRGIKQQVKALDDHVINYTYIELHLDIEHNRRKLACRSGLQLLNCSNGELHAGADNIELFTAAENSGVSQPFPARRLCWWLTL
jgi:hypothetical protein